MVFRDDANGDPITFWPGVYGTQGDDETWNSLVAAIQGVQECQNIDYNRANPAASTNLMSGLVLPPSLSDEWLIS